MKKITAIIAVTAVAVAFAVTGCKQNQAPAPAETSAPTTTEAPAAPTTPAPAAPGHK